MTERKIKFLRDYEVQDEHRGTPKATRYTKGKIVKVSEAAAQHFVSRGAADLAD